MTVIGITGGTGAGKTTALDVIRKLGGLIIDCDAVYHDLTVNSKDMLSELESTFGGVISNGILDRKALGRIVFADETKLETLNRLTHRYVKAEVSRLISDWEKNGGTLSAIDAIALIESGLSEMCDFTVAVTAPKEVRAKRIMAREGIDLDYALLRINAQKPDSFFKESCDFTLVNDFDEKYKFESICREFFTEKVSVYKMSKELFFKQKHISDIASDAEKAAAAEYAKGYMEFLDAGKTERECVAYAVKEAEKRGFKPFVPGMEIKAGDKIYRNNRGKSMILAVIGEESLENGCQIAGAHVDSPRLDLKQLPLYEDSEMALFKTHYYGGIKKYQWTTIPLALHGVVIKADGTSVTVNIGEDENDPVFLVTDLLPHLGADQMKKTLADAFSGENLNILIGSTPISGEGDSRVKENVLTILSEKYGICEEDFISAELTAVPAYKAKFVGLDRSLIGAYGHDDRSCAYAELKAIFDIGTPKKTAVCILSDKEEVGSDGVSGMQSSDFEYFMEELCDAQGVKLRRCFEKSFCLSADVCNAFDPNFPEVSEKRNNAKINYGLGILKFTGARGKSGSSDASAEVVSYVRRLFAENGVVWQMAELGKVDQGGGGTIAKFMANRNIDTIDAGVPVLSMHAPYETVSVFDCYMTYKGVKAVYEVR